MVKKKTFLCKQKLCFVRQTAGEDEREYLVRVERLSQKAPLSCFSNQWLEKRQPAKRVDG